MRRVESEKRKQRPSILKPGTRLQLGNHVWRSNGRGPKGRILLVKEGSTSIRHMSRQQVDSYLSDGRGKILPPSLVDQVIGGTERPLTDLSALNESEQVNTRRRAAYVRNVIKLAMRGMSGVSLAPVIGATAEQLNDPKPPHWRTVIDWVALYRQTDSVIGLADQRTGNSKPRLSRLVRDVIETIVHEVYLSRACHSIRETHRQLKIRIATENGYRTSETALRCPSMKALRHYISTLDGFDVLAQRRGYWYAHHHYRSYGLGVQPTRPLEIVEIDSTTLDCRALFKGVLDLGRPTLTIAICRRTRCVLYAGLSFEPPSYSTVMDALVGIILGRDELLAAANLPEGSWKMRGVPCLIRIDNGKEYRSSHLENACADLGVTPEWCPPRQPWFKGVVERSIGTLNTCLIQKIPGHQFPLKLRAGDLDNDKLPLLDIDDLQALITKWITTIYHKDVHAVLGKPPSAAWDEETAIDPPQCPFSEDEVRVYCGKIAYRTVQAKGITVDSLLYNSDELGAIRHHIDHWKDHPDQNLDADNEIGRRKGDDHRTVKIKRPGGMECIYVLDPLARIYVRVPAIAQVYTKNLSHRRHKLNQQYANWTAEQYVDEGELLAAHRAIDEMIQDMSLAAAANLGKDFARATVPDTRADLISDSGNATSGTAEPSSHNPADIDAGNVPPEADLMASLRALSQTY